MPTNISDLILRFFQAHPKQDLQHGPVVDWVEERYLKLYKKKPRDTWRTIRMLHQEGVLIKVRKGGYRYDADAVVKTELLDFQPDVKDQIFQRDNNRCVVCGRGRADGVEICADHRKPKDRGGTNTLENGQTLCTEHNLIKKNYSQTEAGKRYFIKLYEQAVEQNDLKMVRFCNEVFDVYDRHEIDRHIPRPDRK